MPYSPSRSPQNTTQNLIMVTAIDDFARRNELLSDDEIKDEVFQVLQDMYGYNIPKPTDILVPRWTLDPLYRGSYSNWPIGALDQHHENLGQPVGHGKTWLHFTGEAMSEEMFGYVQGAWDEGLNTAGEVAECLAGKCPKDVVYEALKLCTQKSSTISKRHGGEGLQGKRMQARRGGRATRSQHN